MKETYRIPLTNTAQSFRIMLMGKEYLIENRWNSQGVCWEISFFNEFKEPLLTNLPLVCGVDLLYQHRHILPASLVCYTQGDSDAIPTYENLGKEAQLYFMVTV